MTSLIVVYKAVNKGLTSNNIRRLAYVSLIGRDKLLILNCVLYLVGVL
jgi:hypothetical protein